MEDRYLFRGKRVDDGEWAIGYYVVDSLGCQIVSKKDGSCFNVTPETVGQCTGLKDKNGVLIFEGDKINTSLGIKTVVFSDDIACFEAIGEHGARCLYGYTKERESVEIIGNIHDEDNQ